MPALFLPGNPISPSEEAVLRGAAPLICPSAGALYVTDTNTCWGDRIDPCPPRLLATAFSPLKASTSIPSSRQGMLALASLLPPVLTLAESSLGSPSSPGKGLGTQDRATPQGQLGTPSFPGDGQRLAYPSAPGDPAYLSRQLTSGSPLQGQFDFYLPGPAPGNPSNSRLKPWAATADDKPSCSSHLQHLL